MSNFMAAQPMARMRSVRSPSPKRRRLELLHSLFVFQPNDCDGWAKHYHEQGFVVLKDVIGKDTIEVACQGLTSLVDELADRLLAKGAVKDTMKQLPFETRLAKLCDDCPDELPNLYRAELHRREFFGLLCHADVLQHARRILTKADALRIFPNYSARPKTAHRIHDVVWHQDAGLQCDGSPSTAPVEERLHAYGIDSVVNCWTPLVPARVHNGAMKFIPGSQKLGILPHVNLGRYAGKDAAGGALQSSSHGSYMTGVEPGKLEGLEASAVDIELDPGDVVFFSNLLVHRGGQNATSSIRWSFDWRYQDAAKPTCRPHQGHVVWSRNGDAPASTAERWANLSLC